MKKILLSLASFIVTCLGYCANAKMPNIVLFLLDDLGYGSIGANGAPKDLVATPNMDSIAHQGMRFINVSTPSSVSSPTRYSILTGAYPWRSEQKSGVWGYEPRLIKRETLTLQQMLRSKGYKTACVGKWHLGYGLKRRPNKDMDFRDDLTQDGVNSTGFDYSFTIPSNHGDTSGIWMENDKIWGLLSNEIKDYGNTTYGPPFLGYDAPQRVDEEAVEMCTKKAIEWMKTVPKDKSFFLYLPTPAIHEPITPSKKNKGKSKAGIYGDFIMDADDSVGELIAYLKERGDYDNTIFILTSDNGGQHCAPNYDRAKRDIPILSAVQDAMQAGFKINGDFRAGKTFIFEGGTRVPFFVRWPKKIPAGKVSDNAFSLVDLMATLAHISEAKLEQNKNCAPDSYNVFNIWQNKKFERQNIITANAQGVLSIRNNNIKYIEGKAAKDIPPARQIKTDSTPQLYDLNTDAAEKIDIIGEKKKSAEKAQEILDKINGDDI